MLLKCQSFLITELDEDLLSPSLDKVTPLNVSGRRATSRAETLGYCGKQDAQTDDIYRLVAWQDAVIDFAVGRSANTSGMTSIAANALLSHKVALLVSLVMICIPH